MNDPVHSAQQSTLAERARTSVPTAQVLVRRRHRPQPAEGAKHPAIARGEAGGSVRRRYEQEASRRQAHIRAAHPRIGGFLLALSGEPQSVTSLALDARGERLLGAVLDGLDAVGVKVLHDRRVPGSVAVIGHVAVTATGVFVIDAKRVPGEPRKSAEDVPGGRTRERLIVGRRDCTTFVEEMREQVATVKAALSASGHGDVPVAGMLCFIEAKWSPTDTPFSVDGVHVLWPRAAAKVLTEDGFFEADRVEATMEALATAFPPA